MMRSNLISFIVLSLAGINVCYADVSLYMPGFDPQPISVNIVGVGSDGETTYQVVPGEPTGTWVGQDPAFIGTGTLVEGAGNAVFSYANAELSLSFVESCTIVNGIATCNNMDAGQTTFVDEENATPMLVQGGGTAAPAPTGSSGSGTPAETTAAPGGSPAGSAPTGSTPTQSTTPSPSGNSGVRSFPSIAGSVGVLAAVWAILG
ncbi:hypothetical protein HYDPIDRAFT_105398 [Hydnomerulius pinastri MD-312]|nr:hypothetical protein HYDPIDRAFT_105398 [Hydnomerulius pinastri MD-312]